VFVDTQTPEYQALVESMRESALAQGRNLEFVLIDADRDGIRKITDTLAQKSDLNAVHIISHASDGAVQLGSAQLDFESLLKRAASVKKWGEALTEQGDILWKGQSLMGLKPNPTAERGIARTFQNIALYPHMTVLENILTGRHVRMKAGWLAGSFWWGKAKKEEITNREIVESIIDFLEIEQWRKYPVGLLPYGIQKRVELGRALAMDPELLMLDEPVAGMNLEETEDMARFILDVKDELGIAMILVEHDMGLVMDIADRILVVDFGKPIATGVPEEIQQNPNVIKAYLGEGVEAGLPHDQRTRG